MMGSSIATLSWETRLYDTTAPSVSSFGTGRSRFFDRGPRASASKQGRQEEDGRAEQGDPEHRQDGGRDRSGTASTQRSRTDVGARRCVEGARQQGVRAVHRHGRRVEVEREQRGVLLARGEQGRRRCTRGREEGREEG